MQVTKTQDWPFLRSGTWGTQIGYQETPQKFLRHPRRCKIEFQAQYVFFTFGRNRLKTPFLAICKYLQPSVQANSFFWPKMAFRSDYGQKWRKRTKPKIQFYTFQGVSKISGGSPSTLSIYPMFQISKRANPTFQLLAFLKSLDLPQTPCDGIFHVPRPSEKVVARTGVFNNNPITIFQVCNVCFYFSDTTDLCCEMESCSLGTVDNWP